ncbi:MAG: hypothetical protein ABI634_05025 [Acidobacteriota bacterium]
MSVRAATNRIPHEHAAVGAPTARGPLELWRVRGATDDLRGLAIDTSFGYALGLELDEELVLLHLQPSLEVLVAYADRIEAALLAQGWQRLDSQHPDTKERS